MPELPEVETTLRGIIPHMLGQTIDNIIVRQRQLRYPIPAQLSKTLANQTIQSITRRGKYLLLDCLTGTLIIHLGMSGRLHIIDAKLLPQKHDHVDIVLKNALCCRYTDPRRFGCIVWTKRNPFNHKLITSLGVEPLESNFDGDYLYTQSRNRHVAIKKFIMNSHVVVGVGNIYATEALFYSGIHPARAANKISRARYVVLAEQIKQILTKAIECGGTTLRDFRKSDGKPGYFVQELAVYGRQGEPCIQCGAALRAMMLDQRTSAYCHHCQR